MSNTSCIRRCTGLPAFPPIGWPVILVVLLGCILARAAAAEPDLMWGANGHPFSAYPGIPYEQQLDHLKDLGMRSYRVNISDAGSAPRLAMLVREAKKRGIEILPVITPAVDLERGTPATLYAKAHQLAFNLVSQFKDEIRVWELGNEMEVYAIIKACEMRDDGVQYNCAWGPAGGVGALEYYGPRWAKVSAVLKGLSDGAVAADPTVRKAMGTAGWGHIGAFERMQQDGIRWDISVWHMYGQDPEWGFKAMAKFGRPIWVTEFNHPLGSKDGEQAQAEGLKKTMLRLRELRSAYKVEAAHVYELLDEPYWAPNFEAVMGLITVEKNAANRWVLGRPKVVYHTIKELIADGAAPISVGNISKPATPPAPTGVLARRCQLADYKPTDYSLTNQVAYSYCLILGRPADGGGAQYHVKLLSDGRRMDEVLIGMLFSSEFARTHGLANPDNRQYIDLLYQVLLDRHPDGGGLAGYLAQLEKGSLTRADIARGLITSAEFHSKHGLLFPPQQAIPATR